MQAMHGSVVSGPRRCRRLIGCLIALVALSAMVMPSIASAAKKVPPPTSTYLALGNSLAYGYSTQLYNECKSKGDPGQCFENGYANAYLKTLKSPTTQLTNDGCPGETTESLIGNSPVLLGTLNAVLKGAYEKEKAEFEAANAEEKAEKGGTFEEPYVPVTGESPCAYGYSYEQFKTNGVGGQLHNAYGAGGSTFEIEFPPKSKTIVTKKNVASQLENARNTIKADKEAGAPEVTTVSLDIGANDSLHTLGAVEAEAKAIILGKVVAAATAELTAEIKARITKRVETEAAPECYGKGGSEAEINQCIGEKIKQYEAEDAAAHWPGKGKGENAPYEGEVGAKAAAYGAAHKFELGEEGEKIASEKIKAKIPGLIAQMNKNLAAILLVLREGGTEFNPVGEPGVKQLGGVNYNGKIIFLANYNPYGKQFHYAFEGVEFVETLNGGKGPTGPYAIDYGRCAVHAATEAEEAANISAKCIAAALHIGFTSIQALINNYTYITAHNKFGACDVDALTQWNPGTAKSATLEPNRLKKWTNMTNATSFEGTPNGPDIHPTPAGYKRLSAEMHSEVKTCTAEKLPGF